ncbi:hypothetical protein QRX50_33025 [Amycolatopsis carbonis]|uniref:Uncharacterized protein n=1 Tax=Amycolatopsis carbonis TaxID=715471 RepID=A0A9Y2MPN7_9PSEU|nr:hypothetical protein [Amycolatopsis sp. 2-15]WIX76270.1 hypothetical protein QRX50_33025 [Amycolatopsis sp. 2-15]
MVSGLAVIVAGCSSGAAQTPVSAVPKPPPVSSSAPPSSVVHPPTLERLLPTEDELAKVGQDEWREPLEYVIGPRTPLQLVNACGAAQPWDAKAKQGAQAYSSGGDGQIAQLVAEYDGYSGAQIVDGVKKALACGHVTVQDLDFKSVSEFPAPKVADAQYGFCAAPTERIGVRICVLVLGTGDRAESLVFKNTDWVDRAGQSVLKKVAPVFAEALARP